MQTVMAAPYMECFNDTLIFYNIYPNMWLPDDVSKTMVAVWTHNYIVHKISTTTTCLLIRSQDHPTLMRSLLLK